MVIVDVINPKDRKSPIRCSVCGLKYSLRDYKILYENKKLIYFYFKPKGKKRKKVICHDCLLKQLKKFYPRKETIRFQIKDGEDIYDCSFHAGDIDEFPDEFF
tara:strand:+ start:211 stop:519 length:309 start_codon:yes stop_codon:yes gene_type:complete